MSLYPYQQEAIHAVLRARVDGLHRMVVALATGGGKTVLATKLAALLCPPCTPQRVLWLCRTKELALNALSDFLVHQYSDTTETLYPVECVGLVQAEHNQADAQVVVALVETLQNDKRLEQVIKEGKFDLVIADEAHEALSMTYRKVIDATMAPGAMLIGLTATPYRSDNQSLEQVFVDGIVYARGMLDLMVDRHPQTGEGYLADLRCPIVVTTDVDLSQARETTMGELVYEDLEQAVAQSQNRYPLAVAAWKEYAENRPTLHFAVNTADAYRFAEAYNAAGIPAAVVLGITHPDERQRIMGNKPLKIKGAFELGEYKVLVGVGVFIQGQDFPFVGCLVMARHCRFSGTFIQMLGRGVRRCGPHPLWPLGAKKDCIVIDLADNKHTVLTLNKFVGSLDPKVKSVRRMVEERKEREAKDDPFWQEAEGSVQSYKLYAQRRDLFSVDKGLGQWWRDSQSHDCHLANPYGKYTLKYCGPDMYQAIRHAGDKQFWLLKDPRPLRHAQGLVEQDALQRKSNVAHREDQLAATYQVTPTTLARAKRSKLYMIQPWMSEGQAQQILQQFYADSKGFHTKWYAQHPRKRSAKVESPPAPERPVRRRNIE